MWQNICEEVKGSLLSPSHGLQVATLAGGTLLQSHFPSLQSESLILTTDRSRPYMFFL